MSVTAQRHRLGGGALPRLHTLLVTLVTASAVVACVPPAAQGSSVPAADNVSAGGTSPAPVGATAHTAPTPSHANGHGAPASAHSAAHGSNPTASPTITHVGVEVAVTAQCVVPGAQQTETVTSTPGLQVTVNPRYADGKMGDVYGGLAFAQTVPPDGRYVFNFTVSLQAPTGPVTVYAGVASTSGPREGGQATTQFSIASRC